MFLTLILQYLNELVKSKVRYFSAPKSFHTVKVQGFNRDRIKPFTEIGGKFPMKVFALIRNFSIKSCELPNTTPPTVRTFFFTDQCLVESTKFHQGLFQGLRVLYFLTRAKGQVSVFHTEFDLGIDQIHSLYYIVRPNALTCCW